LLDDLRLSLECDALAFRCT